MRRGGEAPRPLRARCGVYRHTLSPARYRQAVPAADFARIRGVERSDGFRAHPPSCVLPPAAHAARRRGQTRTGIVIAKKDPRPIKTGGLWDRDWKSPNKRKNPLRSEWVLFFVMNRTVPDGAAITDQPCTQRVRHLAPIPSGTLWSSDYRPARARIGCGTLPPAAKKTPVFRPGHIFCHVTIPSGARWCSDYRPAYARIVSRHSLPACPFNGRRRAGSRLRWRNR